MSKDPQLLMWGMWNMGSKFPSSSILEPLNLFKLIWIGMSPPESHSFSNAMLLVIPCIFGNNFLALVAQHAFLTISAQLPLAHHRLWYLWMASTFAWIHCQQLPENGFIFFGFCFLNNGNTWSAQIKLLLLSLFFFFFLGPVVLLCLRTSKVITLNSRANQFWQQSS